MTEPILTPADRAASASEEESRPARVLRLASALGPYVGLLLVIALLSVLIHQRGGSIWADGGRRGFLGLENLKLLSVHAAVSATVALGMTLIIISGGIDLSVGYVVSLATVTALLAYRAGADWTPGSAVVAGTALVLAALLTGGVAGVINGLVVTRLRVVPFVATLGMMGVARGLAQYWAGGRPVPFPGPAQQPPDWVPWLGAIDPHPEWLIVSPAVWSVLLFALGAGLLLHGTVLGRYCYVIGANESAARMSGVRVERTKVILYVLAGLLTGWAGLLQVARLRAGLHDAAAGLELEVIAAVVIGGGSLSGGRGSVVGTLVGTGMITILSNGCSRLQLPTEFRYIFIGAIIVAVAAFNNWRQR